MEFCEFCQNILKQIPRAESFGSWTKQESFRDSASHCRLCEFICPLIDRLWGVPEDRAIEVIVQKDRVEWERTLTFLWHGFSYMTLERRDGKTKKIRLAIWCDEGKAIPEQSFYCCRYS